MSSISNNLLRKVAAGSLCKASTRMVVRNSQRQLTRKQAFGIRMVTNPQIVQLAKNAGFDALFIDLEHSTISLEDAGNLACAGLAKGITPFVRVPHQCGNGFVQRVLDAGAMGVVFPHISNADDARAAVAISKYPSTKDASGGCRSVTGQLPFFSLKTTPLSRVVQESNSQASSVVLMIETREGIEKIDEIAAVDGVDVLLVGTNDLSVELGSPGEFKTPEFRTALEKISKACRKYGRSMGLAGIYGDPAFQAWAIRSLGVRFMLCQQDSGILAMGAIRCCAEVEELEVE